MQTMVHWEGVADIKIKAILITPLNNIKQEVVNYSVKILLYGDEAYRTYFVIPLAYPLDTAQFVNKTVQDVHDALKEIDESYNKLDDLIS